LISCKRVLLPPATCAAFILLMSCIFELILVKLVQALWKIKNKKKDAFH
jgi:hypothetical protein